MNDHYDDYYIEKLRSALIDYYGTAAFNGFPMATVDLSRIEYAGDDEIIAMARSAHII